MLVHVSWLDRVIVAKLSLAQSCCESTSVPHPKGAPLDSDLVAGAATEVR